MRLDKSRETTPPYHLYLTMGLRYRITGYIHVPKTLNQHQNVEKTVYVTKSNYQPLLTLWSTSKGVSSIRGSIRPWYRRGMGQEGTWRLPWSPDRGDGVRRGTREREGGEGREIREAIFCRKL